MENDGIRRTCQPRRYAGLIIALWMYCRKTKDALYGRAGHDSRCHSHHRLLHPPCQPDELRNHRQTDRCALGIRLRARDMLPRHPAQLYEAIAYFIFFLGMVWLYKRGQKKQETKLETDFSTTKRKSTTVQAEASLPYHRGFFFGLCLTEIFTFRFFIEFLKENQVNFEDSMTLNMGQWLSIPFVIIGVYFMCFYGKKTAGK